ncbi:hypothetical protein [Proteiniphilum sp.]|uniref:hypothetical protein n=1 Tax=Proteiniphilum sp. TaxID=1926877 RepID=UPI0033329321
MNKVNENKRIVSHVIPISILLIAIYSVLPYLKKGIPLVDTLNNTTVWWSLSFLILLVFFLSRFYFFDKRNEDNMLIIWLYLLWNLICVIRGMFVAEIYWDWKGLINNAMALLLPIVIFSATNKMIVQSLFSFFIKYALPLFIVFALIIRTDAFGFYLMPISILLLFFPAFSMRQRIFLLLISLFVLVVDLGARSSVIKFGVPFLLLAIYFLRNIISVKWIEGVRLSLFIIPVLFFVLGITNIFNVFKMDEYFNSDYKNVVMDTEGNLMEESLAADTRTFLYVEVLESAINHNYWLLGRTPARGNDSDYFGGEMFEMTGRYERLENEIGLANVFTWTGVVGIIFYFLIFFQASYLAVNKSNNIYMKIVGVFIAFRWLYAWIEDVNNFSLNYFMLMVTLGICFSYSFRKMTNKEVLIWVRGIFDIRYIRLQQYLLKQNKYENKEYRSIANVPQQES